MWNGQALSEVEEMRDETQKQRVDELKIELKGLTSRLGDGHRTVQELQSSIDDRDKLGQRSQDKVDIPKAVGGAVISGGYLLEAEPAPPQDLLNSVDARAGEKVVTGSASRPSEAKPNKAAPATTLSPSLLKPLSAPAVPQQFRDCLLYTSPSPRDQRGSRMPSSA